MIASLTGRLVFLIAFAVSAFALVAGVNGYLYDSQEHRLVQTGLINLTIDQVPVTVTIDGKKKVYKDSPVALPYLLPGRYWVEVTKEGYSTWQKSMVVNSNEVVVNPFIELFLLDVDPSIATSEQAGQLADAEMLPVYSDLDIRGREIWAKPLARTYPFAVAEDYFNLIARFSSPVLRATWYPDHTHIVYQVDRELHIADRDGSNNYHIVTLENEGVAKFVVTDNGKTLLYQDGPQAMQRALQL